jgi:hypothetical protein
VCDDIRAVVIEGIGAWILELPQQFLGAQRRSPPPPLLLCSMLGGPPTRSAAAAPPVLGARASPAAHRPRPPSAGDQYLKYLAWAQSDRAPVVRAAAVAALVRLYGVEDNLMTLREFTGRCALGGRGWGRWGGCCWAPARGVLLAGAPAPLCSCPALIAQPLSPHPPARFATRFCELVHDVDEGVAVLGVQLLSVLVRTGQLPQDAAGGRRRLAQLAASWAAGAPAHGSPASCAAALRVCS